MEKINLATLEPDEIEAISELLTKMRKEKADMKRVTEATEEFQAAILKLIKTVGLPRAKHIMRAEVRKIGDL